MPLAPLLLEPQPELETQLAPLLLEPQPELEIQLAPLLLEPLPELVIQLTPLVLEPQPELEIQLAALLLEPPPELEGGKPPRCEKCKTMREKHTPQSGMVRPSGTGVGAHSKYTFSRRSSIVCAEGRPCSRADSAAVWMRSRSLAFAVMKMGAVPL